MDVDTSYGKLVLFPRRTTIYSEWHKSSQSAIKLITIREEEEEKEKCPVLFVLIILDHLKPTLIQDKQQQRKQQAAIKLGYHLMTGSEDGIELDRGNKSVNDLMRRKCDQKLVCHGLIGSTVLYDDDLIHLWNKINLPSLPLFVGPSTGKRILIQ